MPGFYRILDRKISKIPKFLIIFAGIINKIPEFHMIFARKMPEFYIIIARKIFFHGMLGGHVPSLPPSPTPISLVELYEQHRNCRGVQRVIANSEQSHETVICYN